MKYRGSVVQVATLHKEIEVEVDPDLSPDAIYKIMIDKANENGHLDLEGWRKAAVKSQHATDLLKL